MRSGIHKAARGRVLATSSRYSSAANSSTDSICGRATNPGADPRKPASTVPAIRRRFAVRRRQAATTSAQAVTAQSALATVISGNPPSRQIAYSSSCAPQFWSSHGLPAVGQANTSVRSSSWCRTISSPALTW
jgi:hypothetical protein